MSNPSYTYYGTPRTTPDDAPFLRPSPALASSLSVEHRDSASTTPTPYDSFPTGTPTNSAPLLPPADPNFGEPDPYAIHGARSPAAAKLEQSAYYDADRKARPFWKKPWFWLAAVVAVAVVVVVIVVPVVLVANKHDNNSTGKASSNTASGSGNGNGNSNNSTSDGGGKTGSTPQADVATWGGDGSTVTRDDGTTFTYHNSFGGIWVSDPANPFNSSARPNSWTPALNEKWTWGVDRVWGVNLGGLFVLEPFIVPSLYQSNVGAVDEWTLSQLIAAAPNGNLTATLAQHYETFITEDDIAQIAGAGLNFVRLPIPFWAIETWADVGSLDGAEVAEPFLARVCWGYILRVLGWARKYGLRVNLDLHTVPGSQNGYNHSGKYGMVNFMNGVMGVANAQRTMDYIRVITEFISQPEWQDVIPMFSVVNEALISTIGHDPMTSFYFQVHDTIRGITGIGEGNGPYMVIHDGFQSLTTWYNFLPGSDRIAMDTHPYFAFDGQPNGEPIAVPALGGDGVMNGGQWPQQACKSWGSSLNSSRENIGVTVAGEFSNGINDCGLYVVGLNAQGVSTPPSTVADCDLYNNWDTWNATMKDGFMNLALASMDALGDWFFWTWKIGNDTTTGKVQAPLWSYQLGLENGWIPTDPRQASGMCAKLGVVGEQFDGTFQSWQTGGAGAGTIAATASAQYGTFPPTSIAGVPAGSVSLLPTYTATRGAVTLPPPTFTASVTASVGDGWADSADTAAMVTPVSGCTYPDAWSAANSPIPTALCPAVGVPAAAATSAAVSSSDPAAVASVASATDSAAAAASVDTAAAAVTSAPASVASTAAAAAALTARRHR